MSEEELNNEEVSPEDTELDNDFDEEEGSSEEVITDDDKEKYELDDKGEVKKDDEGKPIAKGSESSVETAAEKATRIAQERADAARKEEEKKEAAKAAEEKRKSHEQGLAARQQEEREKLQESLDKIEIGSGDDRQTLGELKDTYPDLIEGLIKAADVISDSKLSSRQADLDAQLAVVNDTLTEIAMKQVFAALDARGHSDAAEIIESDEYEKWLDSKDAAFQALVDSGDIDSYEAVLDAYKEENGIEKKKPSARAVAQAAKAKRSALHKSTIRKSPGKPPASRTPDDEVSDADLEDAFNEEAERDPNA